MSNLDDLQAVLVDLSVLEKYSRKLSDLIDQYKKELEKQGWTAYQPYTDGFTLKYGIVKNELIQEYDQFLNEASGLYFQYSRILKDLQGSR